MSDTSLRIAMWIWRDLSLRAGFREVVDQIGAGGSSMIVDYWAARIEEEIGDNRFIAALEKIRDEDYRGPRPESSCIAARALGPRGDEQAAAAGVKQYAAPDGLHVVQQDLFHTPQPQQAPAEGPTPTAGQEELADI